MTYGTMAIQVPRSLPTVAALLTVLVILSGCEEVVSLSVVGPAELEGASVTLDGGSWGTLEYVLVKSSKAEARVDGIKIPPGRPFSLEIRKSGYSVIKGQVAFDCMSCRRTYEIPLDALSTVKPGKELDRGADAEL